MSSEPQLRRKLERLAEQAVPQAVDLWPAVQARLRSSR